MWLVGQWICGVQGGWTIEARNGWSLLSQGCRERCGVLGPLGEGLTERHGASAGRAHRSTPPASSRGSSQDPALALWVCHISMLASAFSLCVGQNLLCRLEGHSSRTAGAASSAPQLLSCTFDFNFSSLGKGKKCQVSDLGEGSGCLLG